MRLFTALWPSDAAIRHMRGAVRGLSQERLTEATRALSGFRMMPEAQWHVTLCFHGSADPEHLARRLDRRVLRLSRKEPGLGNLRLRIAGAGTFRGVLWVGVHPEAESDANTLRELVRVAGGNPDVYRGHLTLARWNRGRPDRALLGGFLAGYEGPRWTVPDITLVRSEQHRGGPRYSVMHRVGLTRASSGDQGAHLHP